MALHGQIQDFGLGDIFQLVGIQRKTGVLTLEKGRETVTLKFLDGQVVDADMRSQSVEDLLGSVLVRTGRITEKQLASALRRQKRTLQRLGYILVEEGLISQEELIEALRVQSLQIVYRLFRWSDGEFRFHPRETVDYDSNHFMPINTETILMEGARMIDEWPIIERRIRSDKLVLGRTEAAEALDLASPAAGAEIDIAEGAEQRRRSRLSPEERQVLSLVDGERSVAEINDRCTLGEFDTYRILADLMARQLLVEIRQPEPVERPSPWRAPADAVLRVALLLIVAALALHGLVSLPHNPMAPWRVVADDPAAQQLRLYSSQVRLERIERAVQVFYLDAGQFPAELELLARHGYLDPRDLRDPWGRAYAYELSAGGYRLQGLDGAGQAAPGLTVEHRFSAVQRMMEDVRAGSPPPPSS